MTPINQKKTFLDLAKVLKIPVLLVSANYLGAISHTLSAAAILKNEKIISNVRAHHGTLGFMRSR